MGESEGEGDAFRAGRDDIDTLTAVVGKGWAKGESKSLRGGQGRKRQGSVGQGVNRVGGEVVWEAVEVRPGREGGIGAQRTHDVQGDFGIGEESVPEVLREVRVGGGEYKDEVVFACSYCPLCRVGSVGLWGHKCHRQPLREKVLLAL